MDTTSLISVAILLVYFGGRLIFGLIFLNFILLASSKFSEEQCRLGKGLRVVLIEI
jgi:hypothetical protein